MITAAGRTSVSHRFAARFLHLAAQACAEGDPRRARNHFLAAIRHDPTADASLQFGRFLIGRGQREEAVKILEEGWQISLRRGAADEIARCCRSLALLYRDVRNTHLARRFMQRAADAEMSAWRAGETSWTSEQLLSESLLAMDDWQLARARALCNAALESSSDVQRSPILRHLAHIDGMMAMHRLNGADPRWN